MKRLFAGVFLSAAVSQLHAAVDFYDSFNYSPADTAVSTAASPTWSLLSGATDPRIASGSLSYPGLQTASGDNSVALNGSLAAINGVNQRLLGQVYNIGNVATLYYSLTFQVTSISGNDWGGSGNWSSGSFMLGFNQKTSGALANGDTAAPLLIRTGNPSNTGGTADTFQGFQLGSGVTSVAASRVFDGTHTYNVGDTLFLVLSYTFGAGASDDIAKLYVNPTPGSLESANTPVVTATGVTDVTGNQISSFYLRNNSVEPTTSVFDDLRVGTTWGDVTPAAVPEPSTGALICVGGLLLTFYRRCRA